MPEKDEASEVKAPALGTDTPAPPETQGDVDVSAKKVEPDEPLDNAERSRLGRRFSKLEQDFMETKQMLGRMEELLQTRETPARREEDRPPEYITTPDDLDKYLEIRQLKEAARQTEYARSYIGTVKTLPTDDIHDEVLKEMLEDNVSAYLRHTGDPRRDAQINYRLAKAAVLEKKIAAQRAKPNVKGDKEHGATGVTATSRVSPPPKETVELDEWSKKFVKAVGASSDDEWVQKSIKRTDL